MPLNFSFEDNGSVDFTGLSELAKRVSRPEYQTIYGVPHK